MSAATWKIDAAKAGPGNIDKAPPGTPKRAGWSVEKVADATAGVILSGLNEGESNPIPVVIPKAGTYRVWVRHYHTPGKYTSFYVLFRDSLGQSLDFHNIDFKPNVATAKPEAAESPAAKDAKPGFVWTSFDITFERPMEGTLSFGPTMGLANGKIGIDCVIITDEKSFDPVKADVAKIGSDAGAMQPQTPPAGMQPAPVITAHSSFFAGETDPEKQYMLAFLNQGPTYHDYAWAVQMGGNFDHGWSNGSSRYGIGTEAIADYGYMNANIAKSIPEPAGRFVNSEGKMGKNFSISYEPFRKAYMEAMVKNLGDLKDNTDIKVFGASDEGSGYFDYGDAAKAGFHSWLNQKFGSIEKLNTLWNSQYKSFDEIPLPQKPTEKDNKALWFAFREFSGLELANFIAAKAKVIRDHDPLHRHSTSQSSCLEINSATFTAGGPMDFEDVINVGFAHEP
ncbi:MAG: beta-galactosidase, partial [Chthoniobacterales bacterium]